MSTSQIDEAILSVVGQRWMKVAMAIAKAARVIDGDMQLGGEHFQEIFLHIESLVRGGRLESQGNIQKWSFSEIRRVSKNSSADKHHDLG